MKINFGVLTSLRNSTFVVRNEVNFSHKNRVLRGFIGIFKQALNEQLQQHLGETNDPILFVDILHREGLESETMWIKNEDGSYRLHPECPCPNLNQGESPLWQAEKTR